MKPSWIASLCRECPKKCLIIKQRSRFRPRSAPDRAGYGRQARLEITRGCPSLRGRGYTGIQQPPGRPPGAVLCCLDSAPLATGGADADLPSTEGIHRWTRRSGGVAACGESAAGRPRTAHRRAVTRHEIEFDEANAALGAMALGRITYSLAPSAGTRYRQQ
jgi:hypothetical protein